MEETKMETVKCAYCYAERPIVEMMRGKIYFRSSKRLMEATNWYCKDKPCHGYDQMAHEG